MEIYPTEYEEQCEIFQWRDDVIPIYPELSLMIAIPNGGYRPIKTARKMKNEGVKIGVSDIFLAFPNGQFCGLWIELKKIGYTQPSVSQKKWILDMNENGYLALWCRGAQNAIWIIEKYMERYTEWLPPQQRHIKPTERV